MPEVVRAPEWRHTLSSAEAQAWTSIECRRAPYKLVRVRIVVVDLVRLEYRVEAGRELVQLVAIHHELELVALIQLVDEDAEVVLRRAWSWHLERRLEVTVAARRVAQRWGLTLIDQELAEEAARRG